MLFLANTSERILALSSLPTNPNKEAFPPKEETFAAELDAPPGP